MDASQTIVVTREPRNVEPTKGSNTRNLFQHVIHKMDMQKEEILLRTYEEITETLLAMERPDAKSVRRVILAACARNSLDKVPKNYEVLSVAQGPKFEALRRLLLKKPAKTGSGVAVVAVMPKPFACPHGRCTYCPGGPQNGSPNSYTGREPATLEAIDHHYDPIPQIRSKIARLAAFGHDTSKTEIVIVGGTFLFMPQDYQLDFIKSCYDALNGYSSPSLQQAMLRNERATVRNVGLTIETKPDYCKSVHIDVMLGFGVTRVEIGVQSLRERVYAKVNRGHTYADVVESFGLAKDAGYKITAHMMPGLPTMTPADDIEDFARLYSDSDLRPDMLKIYPSLVVKGTPLYDAYIAGEYTPYSDHEMINVLAAAKMAVPKWVRIMRVQREIQTDEIVAGPRQGNLRQLVRKRLEEQGVPCRCIRCREAGLSDKPPKADDLRLDKVEYASSGGREIFLSYEDASGRIYGFARLRRPSADAHRPELQLGQEAWIIRELHVYGRTLGVGLDADDHIQHTGLGKRLMGHAEQEAAEHGAKTMLVISAVGTREYYRRLGYSLYGPYMAKKLR